MITHDQWAKYKHGAERWPAALPPCAPIIPYRSEDFSPITTGIEMCNIRRHVRQCRILSMQPTLPSIPSSTVAPRSNLPRMLSSRPPPRSTLLPFHPHGRPSLAERGEGLRSQLGHRFPPGERFLPCSSHDEPPHWRHLRTTSAVFPSLFLSSEPAIPSLALALLVLGWGRRN